MISLNLINLYLNVLETDLNFEQIARNLNYWMEDENFYHPSLNCEEYFLELISRKYSNSDYLINEFMTKYFIGTKKEKDSIKINSILFNKSSNYLTVRFLYEIHLALDSFKYSNFKNFNVDSKQQIPDELKTELFNYLLNDIPRDIKHELLNLNLNENWSGLYYNNNKLIIFPSEEQSREDIVQIHDKNPNLSFLKVIEKVKKRSLQSQTFFLSNQEFKFKHYSTPPSVYNFFNFSLAPLYPAPSLGSDLGSDYLGSDYLGSDYLGSDYLGSDYLGSPSESSSDLADFLGSDYLGSPSGSSSDLADFLGSALPSPSESSSAAKSFKTFSIKPAF